MKVVGETKEAVKDDEEEKKADAPVDQKSLPLCNGTNGTPGVDCRVPSKVKRKSKKSLSEIPTCTERITTDC